jgi:DNA-binding transcriptional MerR regulator
MLSWQTLPHAHFARRCAPMSAVNAPGGPAKPTVAERTAPTYSISDLAQEFALTTRAIRFYEDEGLLSPRRRGLSRIYGERERTRIKLILRGKRLGLSLSEIRELFDIYATAGNERAQLTKFLQMLADRRAMLHQQREDIDAVLAEIAFIERDCRRRLKLETPAASTAEDH